MNRRTNQILERLAKQHRIEVATLAKEFGVSQVTIRRDLDGLEKIGIIERVHGFAVLKSTDNISGRLAIHYEEKRKIADRALELVEDGDTIMIESGSCCAILAGQIAAERKNVTILTNSVYIAEHAAPACHVILTGGLYQKETECLVGPMIAEAVRHFHVRFSFIGVDGFTGDGHFTNKDMMRAKAVEDMAQAADEVVVLTESEKFKAAGASLLQLEGKTLRLYTDRNLPAPAREKLQAQGVMIVMV